MTKVRVYYYDDTNNEFDVVLEDGGIASVHLGDEGLYQTMYYHTRMNPKDEDVFEDLSNGKANVKTWESDDTVEIVLDACNWLQMHNEGFDYTPVYVDFDHVQRDIKQFIS